MPTTAQSPATYHAELAAFLARVHAAASRAHATRPIAFLVTVAQRILSDLTAAEAQRRRHIGEELMRLERDLSHAGVGGQAGETIAQRVGVLKGLLACCALALLLAATLHDDDLRRARSRVRLATRAKIEELATA